MIMVEIMVEKVIGRELDDHGRNKGRESNRT